MLLLSWFAPTRFRVQERWGTWTGLVSPLSCAVQHPLHKFLQCLKRTRVTCAETRPAGTPDGWWRWPLLIAASVCHTPALASDAAPAVDPLRVIPFSLNKIRSGVYSVRTSKPFSFPDLLTLVTTSQHAFVVTPTAGLPRGLSLCLQICPACKPVDVSCRLGATWDVQLLQEVRQSL